MVGGLLTIFGALSIGAWLLPRCCSGVNLRVERILLGGALGLCVIHLIVVVCVRFGIVRAVFFFPIAGVLIAAYFAPAGAAASTQLPRKGGTVPRDRLLCWILAVTFGFFYLVHALAPLVPSTAGDISIGFVNRAAAVHGWPSLPESGKWTARGMEMVFLFAFVLGEHSAVEILNFAILVALALLVNLFGRRYFSSHVSAVAALMVFCSPLAASSTLMGTTATALSFLALAIVYLVTAADSLPGWGHWTVVGLLSGFALAIDSAALPVVAFAVWRLFRGLSRQGTLPPSLAGFAAGISGGSAFWISRLLGGSAGAWDSLWPATIATSVSSPGLGIDSGVSGFSATVAEWVRLCVGGTPLTSPLGPVFLLAPIGILGLTSAAGRTLMGPALVLAVPGMIVQSPPWLMLALPVWALLMCGGVRRAPAGATILLVTHALLSLPPAVEHYIRPEAPRVTGFPVSAAIGTRSQDLYLTRNLPHYQATRIVDERVPAHARVFDTAGLPQSYLTPELIREASSDPASKAFRQWLRAEGAGMEKPSLIEAFWRYGVTHVAAEAGGPLDSEIAAGTLDSAATLLWSGGGVRLYALRGSK